MFSIYLSNDGQSPGDISFGGYDLNRYAKRGATIAWVPQSSNDNYWAVNSQGVTFNRATISNGAQQVIFDNGMSLGMAPERSFVQLVKGLNDFGFKCKDS